MTTLTGFEFQCPACRVRLTIDEHQRGAAIDCPHCRASITAPCYFVGRPGWRPRCVREAGLRKCPACGGPAPLRSARHCARCGHESPTHAPAYALPVARTFSREDRRWSLQHLMLSTDKRYVPDALLGRRARRRFQFYCGDCGSIQTARVWDIAAQLPCTVCDSLVIIPAPRHPARWPPTAARTPPAPRVAAESDTGLFCPQCGTSTPGADRTRHTRAYCHHCTLWF